MEQDIVTKNGKTFLNYSKEKYEKNKDILAKDGYRIATKEETEKKAAKDGFPVKEEVKPKPKAKPKEETVDAPPTDTTATT